MCDFPLQKKSDSRMQLKFLSANFKTRKYFSGNYFFLVGSFFVKEKKNHNQNLQKKKGQSP